MHRRRLYGFGFGFDGIKPYIDMNDDVVVVKVDGHNCATYGLSNKLNHWLNDKL